MIITIIKIKKILTVFGGDLNDAKKAAIAKRKTAFWVC